MIAAKSPSFHNDPNLRVLISADELQGRERELGQQITRDYAGKNLHLLLGYSHPIHVEPPEGISFAVEGTQIIKIAGIDKQQVGQVAANVRAFRKPEPYKGKGIRYQGEQVRRKVGKSGSK